VTIEVFPGQTERAIGFWQRVGRVIAKEEDPRRKAPVGSFDWIVRGARWW